MLNYYNEVIRLRAVMKTLLLREAGTSIQLCDGALTIMKAAESLESEMKGWDSHDIWRPRRVKTDSISDPVPDAYALSARIYFSSFPVYLHWFRFYLARMKLHESLAECLSIVSQSEGFSVLSQRLGRDPYQVLSAYEDIIRWAIDGLLGSIAFSLGEVSEQGRIGPRHLDDGWENGLPDLNCMSAIRWVVLLHDLRQSDYLTVTQRQGVEAAFTRISMEMRFPWAVTPQWTSSGVTLSKIVHPSRQS